MEIGKYNLVDFIENQKKDDEEEEGELDWQEANILVK
jgi:hypothetical protein